MAKLLGIDVHKYYREIDPAEAKAAGANFCMIRAGGCDYYGKQYTDDYFERNADVFPEHMPVGFWYVFRPNHDAHKQAEYFINLIKDKVQHIPGAFDVELKGPVSRRVFADNLLVSLADLDVAFPNKKHIVYTRAGFFNGQVARDPRWALYDLWVARYTSRAQPWGNPGDYSYVVPLDWETWRLWQHSADHNGRGAEFGIPPDGDDDIDLDYFNGSQAEFNAYYQIGIGQPKIVEVSNLKNTTLRDAVKGAHEAALPNGTRLQVIGVDKAADGSTWFNVGGYWVLADHVRVIE
jgi:GH25 family lysozyme M1 (1,4-beta-N-acetylmuramidase)